MAQDFGILVSQPGQNATTATGAQILMDTSLPFIKIDTQNKAGFQTVTMLITDDPPTGVTVVYKYKHNYAYVPSVETLFVITSPGPGQSTGTYQQYFYDYGQIGKSTSGSYGDAEMYACADATYVYYVIVKTNGDGNSNTLLTGTNITITTHVFVEDIGV